MRADFFVVWGHLSLNEHLVVIVATGVRVYTELVTLGRAYRDLVLAILLLTNTRGLVGLTVTDSRVAGSKLTPLTNGILQLGVTVPRVHLSVLFARRHLHFRPIAASDIFRADNHVGRHRRTDVRHTQVNRDHPSYAVAMSGPTRLLGLVHNARNGLPVTNSCGILVRLGRLITNFSPSITKRLRPFVNGPVTDRLRLLVSRLGND